MKKKWNWYNDNDPYVCEWVRNLIKAGLVPDGVVDERSIADVQSEDLREFTQCHFFCGILGWPLALNLAGWPDDKPVWTGSCPCQSFSDAGQRRGFADERHLWPVWFRLIRECRPPVVFGEQVASASVVGASTTPVQDVFGREALFGILRKLKGTPATSVQGMRPICGTCEEESEAYESEGIFQGMETHQERLRACQCREEQSEDTRSSVRSGPEGHTRENRRRDLRGYGSPLRSDEAEIVERSFIGPDSPGGRVHKREYTSRSLLAECHGEYLGGANNNRCCECDKGDKEAEIERIFSEIRGEIEGQSGGTWLDLVSSDMEGEGYAFGAAVLGAHSVGAPNIRQRLWFVAKRLADAEGERWHRSSDTPWKAGLAGSEICGATGGLADATAGGWREERQDAGRRAIGDHEEGRAAGYVPSGDAGRPDPLDGFWRGADWLYCRDGKWRPVESKSKPLVARVPGSVGQLRAYGNAISPHVAAEFIMATMP